MNKGDQEEMSDNEYRPRHGHATLNRLAQPDDFGNHYAGEIWQSDGKGKLVKHWLNGKLVKGSNGPFQSIKMGRPKKTKFGEQITADDPDYKPAGKPDQEPEPVKADFEDDIPF